MKRLPLVSWKGPAGRELTFGDAGVRNVRGQAGAAGNQDTDSNCRASRFRTLRRGTMLSLGMYESFAPPTSGAGSTSPPKSILGGVRRNGSPPFFSPMSTAASWWAFGNWVRECHRP